MEARSLSFYRIKKSSHSLSVLFSDSPSTAVSGSGEIASSWTDTESDFAVPFLFLRMINITTVATINTPTMDRIQIRIEPEGKSNSA